MASLEMPENLDLDLQAGWLEAHPKPGDEIVISGLSGSFPESENISAFAENLFNKKDLMTNDDRRWKLKLPEIPTFSGKIKDVEKFDAAFFGMYYKQVNCMDPMSRLLLEKTFEAIVDAGLNPEELKGTKTGVFIGVCASESERAWFYDVKDSGGLALTGCPRSMYANRVSYWLGVEGPSHTLDTACSSSMYAIDLAYKSLREGDCDVAIVGGSNLCLHPIISLQFARLGVLNRDGRCKCFDEAADGYTRSEAISIAVLQKSKKARRNYAQLVHSKSNCDGYKEHGITYPSGEVQQILLHNFYKECCIDPASLNYLEAHGTGTKVGDPEEIKALDSVFCKGRKTPLLMGSVKSNIGHSEPASGLCSIIKVIIAMETGYIPPNINFKNLRQEAAALREKRMVVVTEKTKWDGGYSGANSFGFGGANCHVLMKSNEKTKINAGRPKDDLPRLVYVSGRTEEAVNTILNDVASRPLDAEYSRLLHEVFKYDISGHLYRGYGIFTKERVQKKVISVYNDEKTSIWFLFGGFESQWTRIGSSLMGIPIFAETMERLHQILSTKGIDLLNYIDKNNAKSFEDNVNSIVGTAVQLALIDLLKSVEVRPDEFLGVSTGEIASAYADECLDLEQAILSSFYISSCINNNKSRSELLNDINKLIPSPKIRSEKWVTTVKGKYCTPEFLIEAVISSFVLPEKVPHNAIIIELSSRSQFPNSLMVLKEREDNVQSLLDLIGKLYLLSYNPRVERMYPDVEFPVSRGTPMISPLVKWNHKHEWYISKYEGEELKKLGERLVSVFVLDKSMEYICGHVIDGRILYPATGYLFIVWETLCSFIGRLNTEASVVFEDVKFIRATTIEKGALIHFLVSIQKATGNFEVSENGQTVVEGRVRISEAAEEEVIPVPKPDPPQGEDFVPLSRKDIYKELKLRGYHYNGLFRGLDSCDTTATIGQLYWKDNYVSFMDSMLQMQILQADTRGLFVPTSIDKVVINIHKHLEVISTLTEDATIPVYVHRNIKRIEAGGITISGLSASAISRRKLLGEPVLETYKFVPNSTNMPLRQSLRTIVQVAYENIPNTQIRTVEYLDDFSKQDQELLSPFLQSILSDLPLIQADVNILTDKTLEEMPGISISDKKLDTESGCLLVIASNLLARGELLRTAFESLVPGGFVIAREDPNLDTTDPNDVAVILEYNFDNEKILLLKKPSKNPLQTAVEVSKGISTLDWLPILQNAVKRDPNTVVYSQNDDLSGILGLVNCLRREPGFIGVRCVFIMDNDAPRFDLGDEFYAEQLRKGLAINVLKDGVWGTYRHFLLPEAENTQVEHAYVNVTVRGDLSSLRWLQGNLRNDMALKANETVINVYYSALNFRDIMTATGRLATEFVAKNRFEEDCVQGLEYSGRTQTGRRVMGMVTCRALSTMLIADPDFLWECPDDFTLEDACTIPVTYGTVFYGMVLEAKVKAGQTILIHAGTGGVGQAAINLALYYGMKVYTTVGTMEKREFVKTTWPQILDNQIGNSRDNSFEEMIMRETKGRGVDVVLNSLAEEKLLASVRCLAHGGKFLEIGKYDLTKNNPVALELLLKEGSFHGIMLDDMFKGSRRTKEIFDQGILRAIKAGAVVPLTRHTFKEQEIEDAFRFMAAGKHIGKVLIKIRNEEPTMVVPQKRLIPAIKRFSSNPKASYIIIGGLGGFGLELADWLVLRGAKNLILTSRKGITTGYQAYRIKTWRSYGVNVEISTEDVCTFEGCRALIKKSQELGPLEGLFNLAAVLKDALFENQTKESFEISFGPKPVALKYLDEVTRRICPNLKLFVVFSSVTSGRGNAGQTNYGMGNSIMERICEQRRKDGYHGLAIEWGAVGEVGLVAEMQENHIELEIAGTLQQRISSCLSVLDKFLEQSDPIVSSMVVAEKRALAGAAGNIIDAVANILGIRNIKTVSFHSTLAELGMDSIMGVEIKQTLEREFEVFLSPQDIRSLTFTRLQEIAAERDSGVAENSKPAIQNLEAFQMMLRLVGFEENSKEEFQILSSKAMADCTDKVFLIPGIEGVATVFEPLAKNLNVNVVCLQLGFENENEEIQAMSKSLYQAVIKQLNDDNHFNLVGYSYGSAITLELAALLEKNGKTGKVVIIDGAPGMLQHMVKQQITADTENQFQNNVIISILNCYLAGANIMDIVSAFENCPTWEEKVDMAMEKAPKNVVHSEQHQRNLSNTIYRRLKAMASYEPTIGILKSKLKLIKPTQPTAVSELEDFGMSQLSQQPVDVVYVDGNHVTILENPECAKEINVSFEAGVYLKESLMSAVEKIEMRNQPTLA